MAIVVASLWINLVTAVTLGLALAFEPSEKGIMRRPPRPHHQPLLTGDLSGMSRWSRSCSSPPSS